MDEEISGAFVPATYICYLCLQETVNKSFPEQTINWESKFQPDRTPKTIILYHELLIIGTKFSNSSSTQVNF